MSNPCLTPRQFSAEFKQWAVLWLVAGEPAVAVARELVKWARAAERFLAAVRLEGRLLIVLYQGAKGVLSAADSGPPVGMWSTPERCPHIHRLPVPLPRARRPSARDSRAPDEGGARYRRRNIRRCRLSPRGRRHSP